MSNKQSGAQNETETVTRTVLAKSQALEGENLTRQQLVKAKGVRLDQIAKALKMSPSYIALYVKVSQIPYVKVSTGIRGRPPIEVTGAVADAIFTHFDPDGTRTAQKKEKVKKAKVRPAHRTNRREVSAEAATPPASTEMTEASV